MCWKCGKNIDLSAGIYRTSTCPTCGADLHSCKNCKFYAPGSHYDCHESVDEIVTDKERANFCDYFSARAEFKNAAENSAASKIQEARNAFNSLFN